MGTFLRLAEFVLGTLANNFFAMLEIVLKYVL